MFSTQERNIVEEFKRQIAGRFPGQIDGVLIYGSKARGDDHEDSDIDILVLTSFDDWRKADQIRACGYELDWEIGSSFSIQVMSRDHFGKLHNDGFQSCRTTDQ